MTGVRYPSAMWPKRKCGFVVSGATLVVLAAACSSISEPEACNKLLRIAAEQHLVKETDPSGAYYCEPSGDNASDHYLIGLHYRVVTPPDWVGSDLVGWYAVRRSDGRVSEWDIAEGTLGKPVIGAELN